MSDVDLDQLSEAARNRGLKLVRSRVRTPAKRRFGKVGLADKSGKAVFGMDARGPVAKPDEVQEYLRKLDARDWGASLDVAAPQRKRSTTTKPRVPANDVERGKPRAARQPKPAPKPKPKPKPPPIPQLRDAKPSDAPRLVELIRSLGADIDEKTVRKKLGLLSKMGELPLVATVDKRVVGVAGRHLMHTIHRPAPVGRIPILAVASEAQGKGIGRMLVEAVEQWCRKGGCELLEVTSNDRLAEAHAFYRHMGFERTSIRFAKKLS